MAKTECLLTERMATPIGELVIVHDAEGNLRAVDWTEHDERMHALLKRQSGSSGYRLEAAAESSDAYRALARYFAGDCRAIAELKVAAPGTPFQQRVWRALQAIRAGETMSYRELAQSIGQPTAVRAVGLANGANPVGIVVPCHRVIGTNGSLTGYGGGLERKRWLLEHERLSRGERLH